MGSGYHTDQDKELWPTLRTLEFNHIDAG
jgi:hypothetical protein